MIKRIVLMVAILMSITCICFAQTVTVGVFENYPGTYVDDNKVKGFWIDIIEKIAKEEHWDIEYYYCTGWMDCLNSVIDGRIDLHTQTVYTIARDEILDYNRESLLLGWTLLLQRENDNIESIKDLEGKRVAHMIGDFNADVFRSAADKANVNVKYVPVPGHPKDVIDLLLEDETIIAGVVNSFLASQLLQVLPVKKVPIKLDSFGSYFTVSNGQNFYLLSAIDKHLRDWKHDRNSPYYEIYSKYYGEHFLETTGEQADVNLIYVYIIMIIIGVAFSALAFRSRTFTSPASISLIYLVFGVVWIIASDYLVTIFFVDRLAIKIQTYKGLIYVLITSGLIFELIRQAFKRLEKSETRYKETVDTINQGVVEVDTNGIICMSNKFFHDMLGYKYPELIGESCWDLIVTEDIEQTKKEFSETINVKPYIKEDILKTKKGRYINIEINWAWRKDERGNPIRMVLCITDSTEKRKNEGRQEIANKILNYLNEEKDTQETIKKCLELIRETFYIHVAAIRLDKNGETATAMRLKNNTLYPYYGSNGLSKEHLDDQHHCLISPESEVDKDTIKYRCLCGAVISKVYDFSDENFTPYGSFWCNNLPKFQETVSEETKKRVQFHSHCVKAGYHSLALVPLKIQDRIIGVLQLCDRRKDAFDEPIIKYFEGLADSIAIAFDRRWAYQRLKRSEQTLKGLFDAIPTGIGIVELPDRTIRKINPHIEKMLDKKSYELVDEIARVLYPDQETYEEVGKTKHPIVEKFGSGSVETQWIRKDGTLIDIILSSAKIGSTNELVFTAVDITEKKQNQEKLEKSEKKYRDLFDNMIDGFALHEVLTNDLGDPIDYRYITVNPAFERITGFKKDHVEGLTVKDVLPEVEEYWIRRFGMVGLTGKSDHFEEKIMSLNNRYFEVTAYCPKKGQFAVLFQDVSQRREVETRLVRMFESAPLGLGIANFKREIQFFNTIFSNMIGYKAEEVKGDNTRLIYPNDKEFHKIGDLYKSKRFLETGFDMAETVIAHKNGSSFPALLGISRVPGFEEVVFSVVDVTEQKEKELEIIRIKNQFEMLISSLNDGFATTDIEGKLLSANPSFCKLLGYSEDELKTLTIEDITDPIDYKWELDNINMLLNAQPVKPYEKNYVHSDGRLVPIEAAPYSITDENGKVVELWGIVRDLTADKEAQSKIMESEERFRLAFETSPDAIVIARIDNGEYIQVNDGFEMITGWKRDEVIGKTFPKFTIWADTDSRRQFYDTLLKNRILSNFEAKFKVKDGSLKYGLMSAKMIKINQVDHLITVVRDITNWRQAQKELLDKEQQLRRIMKMEAVGTLAGGIAHDFNNILQIIGGNVQLMLLNVEDSDVKDKFKVLIDAVDRGASLVRSLLMFSRKVESDLKPTNVNEVISSTHKLLDRVALGPVKIDLELLLDGNIDKVMADSSQIDQIITNLVLNAKDAMPEGGKITISTSMVDCDDVFCSGHPDLVKGLNVVIAVSDEGTGISRENIERIFDPFFTTKEMGKGTGLGLAVVYGIVKNHNGYISCYSEEGIGTEFKIYIPAICEIKVKEQEKKDVEEPVGGTETILVVDDEDPIRDLAKDVLEQYGYKVLSCDSGEKGLDLYKQRQNEIDLVILDLVMPGMSGTEVLEKMIEINPDVKTIVASGYSINGPVKDALSRGAKSFLSKPYSLKKLLGEVRKIIDEE